MPEARPKRTQMPSGNLVGVLPMTMHRKEPARAKTSRALSPQLGRAPSLQRGHLRARRPDPAVRGQRPKPCHLPTTRLLGRILSFLPLVMLCLPGCDGVIGGGGTVHVPPSSFSPAGAEIVFETSVWGGGGAIEDRWENVSVHIRNSGASDPFHRVPMEMKAKESDVAIFAAEVPERFLVEGEHVEYFFTYDFDARAGRRDAEGSPFIVPVK